MPGIVSDLYSADSIVPGGIVETVLYQQVFFHTYCAWYCSTHTMSGIVSGLYSADSIVLAGIVPHTR